MLKASTAELSSDESACNTWCLSCSQHAGSCLAARQLLAVSRAVNQTVGDALSGILLVEAALR